MNGAGDFGYNGGVLPAAQSSNPSSSSSDRLAILFGAIALAFATYRYVERPMTRGLNRAFGLVRRWQALTEGRTARD